MKCRYHFAGAFGSGQHGQSRYGYPPTPLQTDRRTPGARVKSWTHLVRKVLSLMPLTLPSITAFVVFRLGINNEMPSTYHLFSPPTPNNNAVADPGQIAPGQCRPPHDHPGCEPSGSNPHLIPPPKTQPPFPYPNQYGINVSVSTSMFYPDACLFNRSSHPTSVILDPRVAPSSHDPLVCVILCTIRACTNTPIHWYQKEVTR